MHRAHSLPLTHEHGLVAPPLLSASSPAFEMPTVLVHPPEDESMPWCAFDANQEVAEALLVFTMPEMELQQSELDDLSQTVHPTAEHAPAFHRSQTDSAVVMPRRGSTSHSTLSRATNPPGLPPIPESPKRPKEKDDDDIVEVMKVRRGEGMLDVAYAHGTAPTIRRSKTLTLRSRAAQALRSIKNVGKAPRRPALDQIFPAKENEQPTVKTEVPTLTQSSSTVDKRRAKSKDMFNPTHTSTPRLKRRNSQPLTTVFGLGNSESEVVGPSAPDNIDLGFSPPAPHSGDFRTFPYSRGASASTPALQLLKDEPARPTSPTFSLRSHRRKFSFGSLQSILSGNTQPMPEPQQAEAKPDVDDPTPRQASIDDGWDSDEDYDSPRRRVAPGRVPRRSDENTYLEQDISFEMRLNSLHFDSFNFDAEAFL
ncbi:hypothetical protein V8E52_010439 [Russula decolorans]